MKKLAAILMAFLPLMAYAEGADGAHLTFRNNDTDFVKRFTDDKNSLDAITIMVRCSELPKVALLSAYHSEIDDLIDAAIQSYGNGDEQEDISARGEDMLYAALNRLRKNDEILRLSIDNLGPPSRAQCSGIPRSELDRIAAEARAGN